MERYERNLYYVTAQEQEALKRTKIFLGGAGIGSYIAEAILRVGIENITIADGDKVELSNLNRQNYTSKDIGHYKAEVLSRRLLDINPNANIKYHTEYINKENVHDMVQGADLAINALDYQTDIPFVFDSMCKEKGIPVLHPYNLGWAAMVIVVSPESDGFIPQDNIDCNHFEIKVVEKAITAVRPYENTDWLEKVLKNYKQSGMRTSPPQLVTGCQLAAALSTALIFKLITGKPIKTYPHFYFHSLITPDFSDYTL